MDFDGTIQLAGDLLYVLQLAGVFLVFFLIGAGLVLWSERKDKDGGDE